MAEKITERYRTDRIQKLYDREPLDRVAFVHRGYGFCAKNVGFPIADIYEDPQKSYTAQDRTIKQYRSDGTPFYTFVSYGAWEFGGEIAWPDDRYGSGPSVARRPVQEPGDLAKLDLPDVVSAGALPRMMDFAHLQKHNGDPIAFICGSPFTHAANLCGVENFLLWTVTEPELVHRAVRLMTDHILEVGAHYIATFGKGNVLARSAAPTDGLLSPSQFDEFSRPYLEELHTKVLDLGVSSIYCHICGDQNHLLEQWADIPFGDPGMLSFGHEIDLLTAARHFPGHIIAGNVNPQIIASGTPAEIMEASRKALQDGKKCPGGYVFMGGCELSPTTPPYHIFLMQEAVQRYGQF
jgi:uroporphyrinogen decarboxylase